MSYHLAEKLKEGSESVDLLIPILDDVFEDIKIKRCDDGGVIDREFSVDLQAIFSDRTETWASKFRWLKYKKNFNDITIEIMNGNGTRGDFYRFNGGGVTKYIYGWRKNKTLSDIHIINAKKLAETPRELWKGNIEKDFPGIGTVPCYQNKKYGKSWFTAINIYDLVEFNPNAIEDVLNRKATKITNLDEWY